MTRFFGVFIMVGSLCFGPFAVAEDLKPPKLHPEVQASDPRPEVQQTPISEYWLGLECQPVGDGIQGHLGLEDGEGLLVEQIVPDSPADRAGLKRHDILLKAGKERLLGVEVLIRAVDRAKDSTLTLELLRGGEKETVEITPTKRPDHPVGRHWLSPEAEELRAFREWLEGLQPEQRPPLRFRFFHPGTILPPEADAEAAPVKPMPDDMTVIIRKQGDRPAEVTVKRGAQNWEVTEHELEELPDEVRPHVERLLGRIPSVSSKRAPRLDFAPQWRNDPPTEPQRLEPIPQRLEKRLEEMNQRMEQLRRSIEGLRRTPKSQEPAKEKDGA